MKKEEITILKRGPFTFQQDQWQTLSVTRPPPTKTLVILIITQYMNLLKKKKKSLIAVNYQNLVL